MLLIRAYPVQVKVLCCPHIEAHSSPVLDVFTVFWTSCSAEPQAIPIQLAVASVSGPESQLEGSHPDVNALTAQYRAIIDAYNQPQDHLRTLEKALAAARSTWCSSLRLQTSCSANRNCVRSSNLDDQAVAAELSERSELRTCTHAFGNSSASPVVDTGLGSRPSTAAKRVRQVPQACSRNRHHGVPCTGDPLPPTTFSVADVNASDDVTKCLEHLDITYVPLKVETNGRVATVKQTIRVKESVAPPVPSAVKASGQSAGVPTIVSTLSNVRSSWDMGLQPHCLLRTGAVAAHAKPKKQQHFKMDGKWCAVDACTMRAVILLWEHTMVSVCGRALWALFRNIGFQCAADKRTSSPAACSKGALWSSCSQAKAMTYCGNTGVLLLNDPVSTLCRYNARGEEVAGPIVSNQGAGSSSQALVLPSLTRRLPTKRSATHSNNVKLLEAFAKVKQDALDAAASELGLGSIPEPPALQLAGPSVRENACPFDAVEAHRSCLSENSRIAESSLLAPKLRQTQQLAQKQSHQRRVSTKSSTSLSGKGKFSRRQMELNWDTL